MGKRKSKITDVCYTVQSEVNSNEVYNFQERPILCESMSVLTGSPWSKDVLDYHFKRKGETEFSYRGYKLYMRVMQRGKSRGRYANQKEVT